MTTEITIPDFRFSSFYYGEILDALLQYKRTNVPEHTDESPYDPFIQLLRAMALVGHLNNVNLDLVANESTLATAKLPETIRNMLKLIDYNLRTSTPAVVKMLYMLTKVTDTSIGIIPIGAQVCNEGTEEVPTVYYEVLETETVERTDKFSKVFAEIGGVFTDYTDNANTLVDTFSPWGVGTPVKKDCLYFGHTGVLWDQLNIYLNTFSDMFNGIWEFYDGEKRKTYPVAVTDMTGYLKMTLNSYLGTTNRQGTMIRAMLNTTSAYEDVESKWDGTYNYIETTTYLGQSSPSVLATDYTIGSDWEELSSVTDGTSNLEANGSVTYTLPQTLSQNWAKGTVNGTEAYWIRYRLIATTSTPIINPVIINARMDLGGQYLIRTAVQGKSQSENPIGASDGTTFQEYVGIQEGYISGSAEVYVDSELWTEVNDFLSSQPTHRHYMVNVGERDVPTVMFGDGIAGKIPPLGSSIRFDYRYGADQDGNLGAGTITKDRSSISYCSGVVNPRSATGWQEAQWSSPTSLERAKMEGPANLRIRGVALNGSDVETMAIAFVAEAGVRPFVRAKSFEEGFGPKTIELVLMPAGGGTIAPDLLDEINLYFNGDQYSSPPKPKRVVANQMVAAVNYTVKTFNIVATVTGTDLTASEIETYLRQVFQPEAVKTDGITFEWDFGETVYTSRISHEIFKAVTRVEKVVLSTPSSDVVLTSRELPMLGTVTLTIA